MTFLSSKKGTIIDLVFIVLILTILGIALPVIYSVINTIEPIMVEDFTTEDGKYNQSIEIIQQTKDEYPSLWDAAFLFLFLGFWITTLITSFFLDTHPVFFIVNIFILIVMLFGIIFINNMYISLASFSNLLFIESTFPMTYWICTHSFMMSIFIGASILLALYTRFVTQ